eukprot:IDg659t1
MGTITQQLRSSEFSRRARPLLSCSRDLSYTLSDACDCHHMACCAPLFVHVRADCAMAALHRHAAAGCKMRACAISISPFYHTCVSYDFKFQSTIGKHDAAATSRISTCHGQLHFCIFVPSGLRACSSPFSLFARPHRFTPPSACGRRAAAVKNARISCPQSIACPYSLHSAHTAVESAAELEAVYHA